VKGEEPARAEQKTSLRFRQVMNLYLISIFSGTAAIGWWLSEYDLQVRGENRGADLCRRMTRCGVTLLLVAAACMSSWLVIGVIALLAMVWADCLSELFLRGLQRLTNPEVATESDQRLTEHELDRLAMMVQNGWHDKAIALCQKLKESGEASTLAIETALFQIYSRMFNGEGLQAIPVLREACRLRGEGNPSAAAARLEALLGKDPDNLRAILLLIQIYARDLMRLEKADALLWKLTERRDMPPAFLEHVRICVLEWCEVVPRQEGSPQEIQSMLYRPGEALV
jgi:hypothetical protein